MSGTTSACPYMKLQRTSSAQPDHVTGTGSMRMLMAYTIFLLPRIKPTMLYSQTHNILHS
ncbi:hypothetical protein Hamer_G007352 [Homarus americanus]|uniref:Uncharacterized protein n=1 Tax=Homarus americanus TaxID=6706 RepID=A0A8J5JNN7_HOMAM|nr:hypothetical protein Hamer_G007352 [Homarus americanus]